jgi:hypothetical protein
MPRADPAHLGQGNPDGHDDLVLEVDDFYLRAAGTSSLYFTLQQACGWNRSTTKSPTPSGLTRLLQSGVK